MESVTVVPPPVSEPVLSYAPGSPERKVIAQDRAAVATASEALRSGAGTIYVDDKPTGAVVGQQPFRGARGSGTNDKARPVLDLQRWVSPRTLEETLVPATDYRYPFLA